MAHFLEHLVFKGGREVRRLPQGQRDGRAHGRGAQRLHLARPRRLPHHVPRRGRGRGDRPADGLRRPPEGRPGGAGPRARRRDPGDRPRERPAVRRGRAPDRPRRLRRPPARPPRAGPRGAPAQVLARRHPRLPPPPVGGRARRRLPRRQPRARAGGPGARRDVRALPLDPGRTAAASRRRRSRRRRSWRQRESNQSHLRISYRPSIDPRDQQQRAALAVYGTLLGGSMGSRLFDEIREQRGLAYSVYSVDHSFADVPILQLSAGPGVGQVRRGLHAHARDRGRAAHGRAARGRGRARPRVRRRPAGARPSRTRTRSPATRRRRRSCTAQEIDPDAAIAVLDEVTFEQVADVARGISEGRRWPASGRTTSPSSPSRSTPSLRRV